MIDRKGVWTYLAITFGLTYLIEGVLIWGSFRVTATPPVYGQLVIAGVMWIPALAAVVTAKWITREGLAVHDIRFGPWWPYVEAAITVPLVYALIYGLTWLLGLGQPDWEMRTLREMLASAGEDTAVFPPPALFWPALFLTTILLSPWINGLFGFGEELGWRGYLLPKLMPLGRVKATLLLGLIWGIWHAPLIAVGFNYPGYPILGIIWMVGLTTAFSVYLNEMRMHHRSSILAGWIHGLINSQSYGIWRILFPDVNPLLGGVTGLVGIAVWLAVGFWYARRVSHATR